MFGYFSARQSICRIITDNSTYLFKVVKTYSSYSCEVINFIDFDTLETNLTTLKTLTNSSTIFTLLGSKTNEFVDYMYEWGLNHEDYPVVILDLLYPEYFTNGNKTNYDGYYYISSYSLYRDIVENTQMKAVIDLFYADLPIQMHEDSVSAFTAMTLVSTAMGNLYIESSAELRYKLYKLSENTPYGVTEISTSNLMKSYFNIHMFDSESDSLLLFQDHVFDRSPYSAVISNKNQVCDFDEGVENNVYENDIYPFALWHNGDEEKIYFFIREYQDVTNDEGGFGGLNYELKRTLCEDEEGIERSFNQSYRFIISACSQEINDKYIGKLNKTFLLIAEDQQTSACNDSTINLGLSPYQQVFPLLNYLSDNYPLVAFLIMSGRYNNSILHDVLVKDLFESGYTTPVDVIIDESKDKDEVEKELFGVLSKVLRYMHDGGVIFNYLDKYSDYVYTAFNDIICNSESYKNVNCTDSSVYTDKYVIVVDGINSYTAINSSLRVGNLLLVSSYAYNAPYIEKLWLKIFGENQTPTLTESHSFLGYELLINVLSNTLNDDYDVVRDYMLNNNIVTSFGELIVDKDLHLQVPISIMTTDEDGNIVLVSRLSNYFPAETFYLTSDSTTEQYVCDFKGESNGETIQKVINVIIFGPLSNADAYIGNEMVYSFLSSFDLINDKGGIQNRFVSPLVIDSTNDEVVYDTIRHMKNTYHTRIAFGCYDSFTRKGIAKDLNENGVILFYPHDFEGFECKENIIYCGMPFSLRTAYIPWILSTFDKTKIAILYTNKDAQNTIVEYIKTELRVRSITPVAVIEVPITGYDMNNILTLLQSKMSSGVILSLLNGNARFDIYKSLYELGMTKDKFTVISEKVRRVDIDGAYGKYMVGHYIWVSFHKDYYPLKEVREIFNKEYSFAVNTTHGSENVFLAAKIFENAFSNIQFNDSDSLEVPYSFTEALNAIHSAVVVEGGRNVKVFTNNYMSFSISLCQIIENKETGYLEADAAYEYHSSDVTAPNPWKNSDPAYPKYSCNWDTKAAVRGETLREDNYVIGAVFSVKDNDSPFELYALDLLIAMTSKINDLGGIVGKTLNFKIFDPSLYDDDYEKVAKMAAADDEVSAFFGCYTSACRRAFAKEFENVDKYLFYPQAFEGQECYSSIYYFGGTANQLFDQLVQYLKVISDYNDVLLVGSSDFEPNYTNVVFSIAKYKLDDIMNVKENEYRIDSKSGSARALVSNVLAELPNGGIIITALIGDPLSEFLVALNEKVLTKHQFQVVCYGSDLELVDVPINDYIDVYEPSYYFDEVNETNDFRLASIEYTVKSRNSAYESSVYAGMRFWYRAVLKANSLKTEDWKAALVGMEYQTGSGLLKLYSNQYASLPFYLGKVNPETKKFDIVYAQDILIEPMAWNWDIDETHGKMCDHTIGKSKYDIDIINILFGISLTGVEQSMDNGLSNIMSVLLDEFNGEQGGIIGQRIYVTDIDIGSDDETCSNTFLRNFEYDVNNTINLVITTASIDCINFFLSEVEKRDIVIIHIGLSPGESCENNILYANKEPSIVERVVNILNDVTDDSTLQYSVLSTYDEASSRANQYAQKIVKNIGGTIVVSKTFTSTISQEDVDNIINKIIERSDTCFILLFGSDNLHKYVDKYFSDNNVNSDKYKIISYTTGESMNSPETQPFYSIQSYFYTIPNEANKIFTSKVSQYTKNPITERMSSLYAIFHIWAEAVTKMNSVKFSKYQQALYTINFDAPEGNINIDTNNYMNHYIRFGYHRKGAERFDKIYESSSPVSSTPWKTEMNDGYYICDFSTTSIGKQSRQSTVTIGVLTSFSGELASTDRLILSGIKAAVTELNKGGGVLDRMVLMQIRDCESELDKYVNYATELGKLAEVVALFGSSRYSQQLQISEIAIKYDILYFYPAMSAGEFCSKNTFSFGFITYQMVATVKKYLSMRVNSFIYIYDTTIFSVNITKSFINYGDQIKVQTYTIFYQNITDLMAIPENIRVSSAIVLVVTIDNVIETVNRLCEYGIYPDAGYGLYSLTMEQLHFTSIPAKCLNRYRMLATFTNDMGLASSDDVTRQETAISFVTAMNDLYGEGSYFTQHLEAAYTSVKVWAEAAKTSFTFDTDKVRTALYGLSTTTPSGLLVINPNGFSNRVIYGFEVSGEGKTRVTSYAPQPEIAQAYNPLIEGKDEQYFCDFTGEGEKFKYDSVKIALFHDGSASTHDREMRILTLEEYLINDINNNKINGYYIQPIIIFGTTAQDFIDEVHKIENDTDIILFMGCRGDPCRETIFAEAERLNKFFIYTGISEGYMSSKNMLVTGNTAYQKIRASVSYMKTQGVDDFLLILSDEEKMKKYLTNAQYILREEENIAKVNYITVESNRTDTAYYKSIVSKIASSKMAEKRLCLLYFLAGNSARMTLQAMKDYGMNFHEIIAILIRYTRSDYNDGFLTGMPGSLITVSYSSFLTTSLSEAFVSDVQENLGNTAETIQEMEYIKVSFDIWKTAMIQAAEDSGQKIPPIEYLRSCIIGQDVKAPSGSVYVEENLHLQRNIFIMEGNANGDYLQVYPDTGQSILIEPRPYPEGLPDYAKFGKSKGLFEYSSSIVAVCYVMMAIGVLSSISALVFTIVKQKKQIIRAFGRPYSYTLAIHLIYCSFSVLTFIIPPNETNGICLARVAVVGIAFKGIVGLFYAKVTKIYRKFVRNHKIIMKSRITMVRVLLFYVGFILLEILVVVIWFLADIPEYEPLETPKYSTYFVDISIRQCSVSTPFLAVELAIDGTLLLFLIYLTGKTKNAANQQNDSIGMFISTLVLALLGAVMVALDFSISSEPDSILLLRTLGTELIIWLMVLLQYGLKLVNLYLDETANLSTESGSKHVGVNGSLGTTGMHGTSTSLSKMPNSSLLSQSAFLSSKMTHTTKTLRTQQKHN